MAAAERAGWLGGLKDFLTAAEKTHAPRPAHEETVVHIPNGLERLRKAIAEANNNLVEAQAEKASIEEARVIVEQEIAAALAKNAKRQRDIAHGLYRLQQEWVRVTVDLGIKAEAVPQYADEPTQEPD